ncbi:MAG: LPP20 family lipoprotein [Sulfuricaulis sp.]
MVIRRAGGKDGRPDGLDSDLPMGGLSPPRATHYQASTGRGCSPTFLLVSPRTIIFPSRTTLRALRYLFLPLGLGLVLASGLGGCATRTPMPGWINGASHRYPGSRYLIGRGRATTEEAARDRARADLSGIFEESVALVSEMTQSSTQKSSPPDGGKSGGAQSASAESHTADQHVARIQIADVWQDPHTRTYYALAVLSRQRTGQRLRREIERLDQATRNYLQTSRDTTDILRKIGATEQALDAQRERAGYRKALAIVDPAGGGMASAWNTGQLSTELTSLLKQVRIVARVSPDAPEGFAMAVNDALADAGFPTGPDGEPDYILEARLEVQDFGLQLGRYWQRGILEITLKNASDDRARGSRHWDIEVSAQDHAVARQRAFDRAASILNGELRDTLVGFAQP